jgi:hypothetical protein
MNKKMKSFLEKIKLLAETITVVLPLARMLLVAFGVLTLVLVVKYNGQQDKMDVYIAQYNEYKVKAEASSKFADSLMTKISIQENATRAAEARANIAAQRVTRYKAQTTSLVTTAAIIRETATDTIELARQLLPIQDSIIEQQQLIIQEQTTQITELESALSSKDVSFRLAIQRGDSLQSVINLLPDSPKNPNRMFGIKLPSRTVTFIAGVVVGGLVISNLK